jgi:hypothetical protein
VDTAGERDGKGSQNEPEPRFRHWRVTSCQVRESKRV